ncbi:hypothetical protein Sste5344_009916 [Sporothrix stenoceras]
MPEIFLSNGHRVTIERLDNNGNPIEGEEIDAAVIAMMEEQQRQIELSNRYQNQNSEIQEESLARREPPYQTYEEITAAQYIQWVRPAPDGIERLFWTLNNPLETSVGVFETTKNKAGNETRVCVPYYDKSNATWHPVSIMPVSEPRVSSMTVRVHEFEDWEALWECIHELDYEYMDPSEEEIERIRTTGISLIPSGVCQLAEWGLVKTPSKSENGRILNQDDADDSAGHIQVIACCGVPRPIDKENVTIEVRPSNPDGPNGGYVTVHDYVSTVHPWLMGMKSDLFNALGHRDEDSRVLPDDTPLMCIGTLLGRAQVKKTVDFLHESGIPPETVSAYTAGQDVTKIFDKWPEPRPEDDLQKEALARTEPPYRTYEDLNVELPSQWAHVAPDTLSRLFWTYNGSLETAIGVFERDEEGNDRAVCVPYFNATGGTPHPISKMAVSEPRVSSITVHLYQLEDWERNWKEVHWEHWKNDASSEEELKNAQDGFRLMSDEQERSHHAEWGVLNQKRPDVRFDYIKDDDDSTDDDGDADDEMQIIGVIGCCNTPRPIDKDATIVVHPANKNGPDGGYVTVHDFITMVHPWALSLRGEVLQAMSERNGNKEAMPTSTALIFGCEHPESLHVVAIKDHLHTKSIPPETVAAFTVGQDVVYKESTAEKKVDTMTPFIEDLIRNGYMDKWPGPRQ